MDGAGAAQKDIVGKLAKGSLLSRLIGSRKGPLRLTAVPRDHVEGSRARGDALLAGRYRLGAGSLSLADLDFAALGTEGPLAAGLQGFSWLRDLSAAAGRERGAKLAEALVGRWLVAHGTRVDDAWAPELWGERILYWTAYAPYVLSSRDSGYRSALLNTLARGARHLDVNADKAPPGLPRITAWAGVVAAALLIQGGLPRVARGEAGLMRALAAAQFEDGGLVSRSPAEQLLLVDRLGLLRAAYFAARQSLPDALESAAAAALAALHGVTMGDGGLSSWQGGNPGDPARIAALIEGCGLRARPLRQARGWGYHRLSALGTILVIDAAPPPPAKMVTGSASTLAFELSDGAQRLVVNCGGPGDLPHLLPEELVQALRTTAAHSTLTLADTNSTAILDDGALGKGVTDVVIDRTEDNDSSRVQASHDGYVRGFGLVHQRSVVLGNDGKELRGSDQLLPRGRKKIREAAPFAIRFHLAPGIEATATADGMGAILRAGGGAPLWNFRCRGAMLSIEESLHVSGAGEVRPSLQLAVVGEVSAAGGSTAWQFRRSS